MFDHNVYYPLEFLQHSARTLEHRSKTHITDNAELGLQYAAAGYDKATSDLATMQTDQTVAGEAAAKAGFRATQLGYPLEEISDWFKRSEDVLRADKPIVRRELAATHLLHGRALGLIATHQALNGNVNPFRVIEAIDYFEQSEVILTDQHKRFQRWDPYATMLARHWATHEALHGNSLVSLKLTAKGLYRAVRSRQEAPNVSETSPPANERKREHRRFIAKQMGTNVIAGALALTRSLDRSALIRKARTKVGLKLLG